MKPAVRLILALLLCATLHAQTPSSGISAANPITAPAPVAIRDEPHHRLAMQNEFVRVYSVAVQPLDATLLHQHDSPYLYVDLGAADFVNAVTGKPEVHVMQADGETHYSPGGFAHLVRTDAGVPFKNVTMELLHPQGAVHNLCKPVAAGPAGACPEQAAAGKNSSAEISGDQIPYFETDELHVDLVKVAGERDFVEAAPKTGALLVALAGANLNVSLGGEHISFLHDGDAVWLPAGRHRRVIDFLGTKSSFLLVSFKDATATPAAH